MHFGESIKVDLLAQDGDVLFLQCDQELTGRNWVEAWVAGETIHVRLQILGEAEAHFQDGPAYQAISLNEALSQMARRLERKVAKHFYRATIRRPLEFGPHLKVLLEPAPRAVCRRSKARLDHHIRATSPELPGYQATVRDLTDQGIGLDLSGPLREGSRLSLRLEPDGARDTPFDLEAEVCWCRPTASLPQGRALGEAGQAHVFEAGLRLLQQNPKDETSLKAFLASFAQSEPTQHEI